MGQNRIRGGGGVKNRRKSSDIIYVRSLIQLLYATSERMQPHFGMHMQLYK